MEMYVLFCSIFISNKLKKKVMLTSISSYAGHLYWSIPDQLSTLYRDKDSCMQE